MNAAALINFPKPSLVKEVNVNIHTGEDGYTPLPNFICDEGYLAVLSGDAIKCLVLLNRHINGFHIDQKAMGEALVLKITGIKDKRTVRKYMTELANYKLIEIHKENGKSNIYSITFSNRSPAKPIASHVTGLGESKNTQPVAPHVPSTPNAGTFHATAPVAPHVPTTSDMACHSVKEIDLKENIKRDDDKACEEKFTAQENRPLNFIEYQTSDRTAISFPDLCKKYPAQLDFQDQAKASFPNHSPDRIFENLKAMAQWSLDKSSHTPQKWMSIWLSTFMKNLPSDAELKAEQERKAQKQTQTTKTEKPKRVSRFSQFLKPDSAPQNQGEIYDV